MSSEKITCSHCNSSVKKEDALRHCCNCFCCTGCEVYSCPECEKEIVVKPIRKMRSNKIEN